MDHDDPPRSGATPTGGVVIVGTSPDPEGVTSNMGQPSEPVVIGVRVDGAQTQVTISEGSGHLGSGGSFSLDEVLDGSGGLQARWRTPFAAADATWVVGLLHELAAGGVVSEDELVAALRRHGTGAGARLEPPGL